MTNNFCIICNKPLNGTHKSYFCSKKCLTESVEKDEIMIKKPLDITNWFTKSEIIQEKNEAYKLHHPYYYNYRFYFREI